MGVYAFDVVWNFISKAQSILWVYNFMLLHTIKMNVDSDLKIFYKYKKDKI